MTDDLEFDRCARLLRAMAGPERLKIVQFLRSGPKNVGEIASELGEEVVNVSHHLGVLRNAGIALDERHGRFIIYRLHPDVFQSGPKTGNTEHLDFGCCRLEITSAEAGGKRKRRKAEEQVKRRKEKVARSGTRESSDVTTRRSEF